MQSTRHIAIVAYRGVSLLDLSGPLEAFLIASAFASTDRSAPPYECHVVSPRGGVVMTADGVEIVTVAVETLETQRIDTLVTPGAFQVEDVTRDTELIDWVRRRAPDCKRICSVCTGSFLLASAGILDGRRAVTHWMHCALLASRHPDVRVEPDAIFVRDGQVWSSAGVTTGIDLALALIEQDLGHEAALEVARVLVVYLKRAGGQSQYSALLASQAGSGGDPFGELEQWIAENLTEDLSAEALAARVHMSPRNFARVYSEKRKTTPAKAVEAIRIDAARRLLEESDQRIGQIADVCGFKSEEHLRSTFVRNLGIPPREYRKRFTAM